MNNNILAIILLCSACNTFADTVSENNEPNCYSESGCAGITSDEKTRVLQEELQVEEQKTEEVHTKEQDEEQARYAKMRAEAAIAQEIANAEHERKGKFEATERARFCQRCQLNEQKGKFDDTQRNCGDCIANMRQEKNAAAERQRQAAEVQRQAQLKNGLLPILNWQDAVIKYQPQALSSIMISPLLKPDMAVYSGTTILDAEEEENFLRVKIGTASLFSYEIPYAMLRLTKNTVYFSKNNMRIGGNLTVIGRYLKNAKYSTALNSKKIMPVIDVMYIY